MIDYENQISNLPNLLYYSEFLLLATENNAAPRIVNQLEGKYKLLEELLETYNANITTTATELIKKLENEELVASQNLNQFSQYEELKFTFVPFMNTLGPPCEVNVGSAKYQEWAVNWNCPAWKFNSKLRAFVEDTNKLYDDLGNQLILREELKSIMKLYHDYIKIVDPNAQYATKIKTLGY